MSDTATAAAEKKSGPPMLGIWFEYACAKCGDHALFINRLRDITWPLKLRCRFCKARRWRFITVSVYAGNFHAIFGRRTD